MIILTTTGTFENIVNLIEAIIWPITFLITIHLFKHQLKNGFDRITTLKADATGFEIGLAEKIAKKIAKAKSIFSASNITPKSRPVDINGDPYDALQELRKEAKSELTSLAKKAGISPAASSIELCNQLKATGTLLLQNAKLAVLFFEIAECAKPGSFTNSDLQEVQMIYDQIALSWKN